MKITKRDESIVEFDKNKIKIAITKAMKETEIGIEQNIVTTITDIIETQIMQGIISADVEAIQDSIEILLMHMRPDVAKQYILYREERRKIREQGWEMDELQKDIWENKYRYNNETFNEWLDRVSAGNKEIRKIILNQEFLFGGRILANRGLQHDNKKITFSNCYVLPAPKDNIESIFDTAKEMARTYSYGGGVGISLENLRPRGAIVNNSAEQTTGAVSFMELYDTTTALIGQKGRRGALMISLPINHPDIEEFIDVKLNLDNITKANISIMIDNDFMQAYEDNKPYKLKLYINETNQYIEKTINTHELMYKIAKNNWNMAEPGMLFWNRVQDWHMLSNNKEFKYSCTNPCGELPLPDYGACLLGSINLAKFVKRPFSDNPYIDFNRLEEVTRQAVIALNEVLDEGIDLHPLEEQKEHAKNYRPIGLGVMGFADMLIMLGTSYESEEAIELAKDIGEVILNVALAQSAFLAKEHGTYPAYTKDIFDSKFYKTTVYHDVKKIIEQYGLRNSHILSIAPTGSISTMIGVSGGIEPLFATHFNRTTKSLHDEDITYKVYPKVIKDLMKKLNINDNQLPDYVVTAHDIHWIDRIQMQSAWQQNVDSAISSTINLPNKTTVEEIMDIYYTAWEEGLKGVTIYRDGCNRNGILTLDGEPKQKKEIASTEEICPECKGKLEHKEGCISCSNCGWGKCSI